MKANNVTALIFAACCLFSRLFSQAPLTPVLVDGFESWNGTPLNPTTWMAAPSTTISPDSVMQVVTTNTLYPVQSGTYSCKLLNVSPTFSAIGFNSPSNTMAGMGYQISYYARGKGTIASGVTDGTSNTANDVSANSVNIKGPKWHHVIQSVIAPANTSAAQFYLKVRSTGTYTNSSGANIVGIDVDSFVVQSYAPLANVSLYNIQFTTSASGNSPFYGQYIGKTGGIVTAITSTSSGQPYAYYLQNSFNSTWAAILVYDNTNAANVQIGDSVTVQAEVDEFYGMTQLQQVGNFARYSNSNPIPPAIITTQQVNQEMYESTLVGVNNAACQSYTASSGQWKAADVSTVPVVIDNRTMYSYTPTVGNTYCLEGPVNYEITAFNIVPRMASDENPGPCSVSIENFSAGNSASVFPNPFSDILNIKLAQQIQNATLICSDILGKEVERFIFSGSTLQINSLNIPKGIYFLQIQSAENTQIIKVVKE